MLAELTVLNLAFGVIKTTIMNGKELVDAGASLGEFFGAEREVKKKLESGKLSVEDAFKARRDLEKAEAYLKETLNTERVEGYRIWLDFKTEYYREQRAAELKERKRKAARVRKRDENVALFTKVFGTLFIIIAALFGVAFYLKY
jgi:hypothetical protein